MEEKQQKSSPLSRETRETIQAEIANQHTRSILIVNGSAAVALLAFLKETWKNEPQLAFFVVMSLFVLCIGVACAALSNWLRYKTSQKFHQGRDESRHKWSLISHTVQVLPVICFIVAVIIFGFGLLSSLPDKKITLSLLACVNNHVLTIAIIVLIMVGIRIVDQWKSGIVFRFRKFNRAINPGFNIIIPFIETIRLVDMRIRNIDTVQEIMTQDFFAIKIDVVVYYKIFDVAKSILAVDNFTLALTFLVQSKLRDILGKHALCSLLSNEDQLDKKVLDALQSPTNDWGITILSVEIKNIGFSESNKKREEYCFES